MPSPGWDYQQLLAAVGKYLADKQMHDICVLEYEDGLIITGSVVLEGRTAIRRTQETIVLSKETLRQMIASLDLPRRGRLGR